MTMRLPFSEHSFEVPVGTVAPMACAIRLPVARPHADASAPERRSCAISSSQRCGHINAQVHQQAIGAICAWTTAPARSSPGTRPNDSAAPAGATHVMQPHLYACATHVGREPVSSRDIRDAWFDTLSPE